ncbi:hypothetical protein SAMN05519103_08609 [Rhizobiales bacterium GAS113]|nr:hypothetical protein SAMN05519103_08609 [Rhizobiales bacterium GAS113]
MTPFASALACMVILIAPAVARAKDGSVPFIPRVYENPQPSDPIFAQTWPDLIEQNNKEHLEGSFYTTPTPSKNSDILLETATLPIPGGQAIISISPSIGLRSFCLGIGEHHDDLARAEPCRARLTVLRNGVVKTTEIGMVCGIYAQSPPTSATSARAAFDAKTNSIHLYVVIDGKHVERSDGDDPCDHVIPLSK